MKHFTSSTSPPPVPLHSRSHYHLVHHLFHSCCYPSVTNHSGHSFSPCLHSLLHFFCALLCFALDALDLSPSNSHKCIWTCFRDLDYCYHHLSTFISCCSLFYLQITVSSAHLFADDTVHMMTLSVNLSVTIANKKGLRVDV